MTLPETIRIEVKSTTGEAVPVPARELAALAVRSDNELGILAVLFWCGDRNVDGRWLIADAADSFRRSSSEITSVSKKHMERADRGQPWLNELKEHIANLWPPFLHAFFDDAMRGHEPLCEALKYAHEHGTVSARLPTERVLDVDHRDAIQALIDHHGESLAGHIFQDLFAYLVGQAGYATVTLNPVGVPDATVSGLRSAGTDEVLEIDLGRFSIAEVRQLLSHCEEAGNHLLADRIRSLLAESRSAHSG